MKIIQLLQKPQLRGAEIFACQLSNHLMEQGHEVIVVTIFSDIAELPFKGETINLDRPLSKRFYDIKAWKRFASIVKKFKPDIIQANAADTLKFAVTTKLLFSIGQANLVFRNANKMGDFISSKLKWHLNKFYLSQMVYVISVSKECEKDFIATFNYPKEKIKTVEIGVEEQKLSSIPKDLKNIFERGPVLVHIGGFVPEKNHNGLIRIFKEINIKFPDVQLLLLGKGILEDQIRNKVEKYNIENNVHFLGYRTDVLDILHNSQAFILPSLIEGLPAVILEAMYSETPVIAYNVGGIGEVVLPGQTGWLVNKDDEKAFQNAIEQVLAENEKVLLKIALAKKMISKKFLNHKISKRFSDVYKNVLK